MSDDEFTALMHDFHGRGVQPGNFSIAQGWVPLVRELVEKLDEVAPDRWTPIQIKEKFAGLRFYLAVDAEGLAYEDANDLHERVRELVDEAERRSFRLCEWCGADAEGRKNRHGGYLTACDEHAPEGSTVLGSDD